MARNQRRRDSRSTYGFRPLRFQSQNTSSGFPSVISKDPVAIVIDSVNPLNMASGQTTQVTVRLVDNDGDLVPVAQRLITYTSTNNAVVSVNSIAVLTAGNAGSVTITATDVPDSLSTTLSVAVTSPQNPPSSITISPSITTLSTGQATTLIARVLDSDGTVLTGQTGTWSSSSTYVSTVSDLGGDPDHLVYVAAVSATTSLCTITFTV